MSELPKDWVLVPLNKLGRWTGGGTPSKSNSAFWVTEGIPWVSPKDMKMLYIDNAQDHITEAAVKASSTTLVPESSILVVTRSGILSHTLPVAKTLRQVAINQDMKALIPDKGIDSNYILHVLRSEQSRILRECGKSGTTVANLDTDRFLAFQIPLPPLDEQRHIVAKLDTLFARSKRAREELARIPRLVERTKQALLAVAFQSEQRVPLEKVTDLIQYGYTAKSSATTVGPRYLRITDIQNGSVDWTQVPFVSIDASEYSKYQLQVGDIVFARSGATVGKSFLITQDPGHAVFASYLIRIRPTSDQLDPEYASLFFQSADYWNQIQEGATGTGQPNFNGTKLGQLSIPLHSLDQQKRIVRRVRDQLSRLQTSMAEAARATALLDRLDQATLAKAFRGELVPQDPDAEQVPTAPRTYEQAALLGQAME
jgi:type I restriction enzyme, S subunit